MQNAERVVCIHVASPAGEAEFRYPGASYRVQDGCLMVLDAQGADLMAMAPGLWRAAWIGDAQGAPLGLAGAPASPQGLARAAQPPAPAPAQAPPVAAPSIHVPEPAASLPHPSEPESAPAPAIALAEAPPAGAPAKLDLSAAIGAALAQAPYSGLHDFAARLGIAPEEAERSLSGAIGRSVDVDAVALEPIQEKLGRLMPEIMAAAPQTLIQILSELRGKDPEAGFDLIQLRVWIKRNPQKRSA